MSSFQSVLPVRQDIETETVFAEGELRVLAARLDADDDAVAAMTAWLSPEELERGRRCHFERDRRRFAVARALLRRLLGERLGAPPAAVALAAGANGKPMLRGTQAKSGWQFNVSRCGDLALFAFSPRCRVGVDVEAAREVRGADIIAAHFFSPAERAVYRALPPEERSAAFLNCWTRKEAFVKALGAGLSFPSEDFDVSLAPHEPVRLLRVGKVAGDAGWRIDAFTPHPGYVAALVCERGQSHSTEKTE